MRLEIRQDGPLSGKFLMERDFHDLEMAAKGQRSAPRLYLYQWEVPTLSLGYHQETGKIDLAKLEASDVPLVRRPTGGAAVLHSEELTYSIVIPEADDLRIGSLLLEFAGRALKAGLTAIGVDAQLDERGETLAPLQNRTSCFARTSRWEVTANGKKIVGSAQRRLESALLQHGSILIGPDHLRIVDFLVTKDETEKMHLRARLADKSTCVGEEIGKSDIVPALRESMANAFLTEYERFRSRVDDTRMVTID